MSLEICSIIQKLLIAATCIISQLFLRMITHTSKNLLLFQVDLNGKKLLCKTFLGIFTSIAMIET